jgi:hypothetical protein
LRAEKEKHDSLLSKTADGRKISPAAPSSTLNSAAQNSQSTRARSTNPRGSGLLPGTLDFGDDWEGDLWNDIENRLTVSFVPFKN